MTLQEHYSNLVVLQDITHNYHIKTLGMDMIIHNYLGELYIALTDHIDTIGEQIIILNEELPNLKEILEKTFIEDSDKLETCKDIVNALYEVTEEIKQQMIEFGKDKSLTPGTVNLIADEELYFGKVCKKLNSLTM